MRADQWVVRAVVVGIIAITLVALVGGMVLSYQGKVVGDWVVSCIAGGLGAMSALLAKTSYDRAVNVENAEQVGPNAGPVVDEPS